MANEQNLMPIEEVNARRTREERIESARKAGIASGEAKRRKKTRRELALEIANAQIVNENIKQIVKANTGFDDEDITGDAAVVSGVYMEALKGNMQAYDRWEQLTAEQSSDNEKYELPARVIGESFVKINRQIKPNTTYVFEGGRGSTKSSFISMKIIGLREWDVLWMMRLVKHMIRLLKYVG